MPPSDVTQSASSSASPLPSASCARSELHAGRGLGVDDGDQLGRGVGGEHARGVDRLAPLVLDGDHLGAAPAATSTMRCAEHAVDRDDHDVARGHGLTNAASMPADPVPDSGRVRRFAVPKTCRSRSDVSSRTRGTPGRGARAAARPRATMASG